jgi:tripartite ATP-independent transporter DctM subunit
MLRYGYDKRVASGIIAASGTLAQIIPPSLVLIILSDQLGASVGAMYKGAILPGLALVGLYAAYVLAISIFRPAAVPALPASARTLRGSALWARALTTLLPPLLLIFLVLGTIFLGIATPTEGGAMGAAGALILALLRRRLNMTALKQALDSTTKLTTFVVFILIGSTVFSLVFRGLDGDRWVEHLFAHLPGGVVGFLVAVNLMVFTLAFFLDFFEIAFIIVPLVAPIAAKLGIDPVWFGVMLAVNIQTSFMHPPFGFALFYLKSVAPKEVKTSDIYWGALPFVGIQLLMVALVLVFPAIVLRDKAPEASSVHEIQIETSPDDNYLPLEWR